MDLGLNGKVALVTGGSRGIGRLAALRLAAEGCGVAICGRTKETLYATLNEIRALGVPAHGVVANVTKADEVQAFVDESARELGGVDVLVCNVGGSLGVPGVIEATDDDWAKVLDLNLIHAVRAIRSAIPHMQARGGGSVVMVSSISGFRPAPRGPQYAAAKAGLIMLAGSLALELAPHGIRVNTISPGSTIFPGGGWERFQREKPEAFAEFERREFPMGRLGRPEEIADVIVFVSSPRAHWINGTNIPVDGLQGKSTAY